jgi:protein-S-isoprenylcysteine O-methyltransferase Ste14
MARLATLAYGVACYAFFLVTFLYAIGFVGNLIVPKSIDSGATAPLAESLIVNILLLGMFAVQHTVMARPAFKRAWTRFVPKAIERSTFVLFASAVLALLFWQWRPLPAAVWTVTDPLWSTTLWALFAAGWATVLVATFLINHFELFGLTQTWAFFNRKEAKPPEFATPFFYKQVRHPIYLGFIIAFWATPMMSVGHLLFAIATTGYIFVGIFFEERDLIAHFGDRYRKYQQEVGMLMPKLRFGGERRKQA